MFRALHHHCLILNSCPLFSTLFHPWSLSIGRLPSLPHSSHQDSLSRFSSDNTGLRWHDHHMQCFGEAFFLSSTSALHFLFAWTMCMDFNLVSSGTSSLRHGHHYSFELSMSPKTLWPPRQPVPSWDLHLHALPPLPLLLWLHLPPLHLHCQPTAFHPPTVLRQDSTSPQIPILQMHVHCPYMKASLSSNNTSSNLTRFNLVLIKC